MEIPEGNRVEKDRPRVLIVDDDPDCRRVLTIHLTEQGYDISEATEGDQAVRSVDRDGADVVILEILLKDSDGFEVLERLRATEATPSVILLSSSTGVDYRLRGLHAGASDYITKPFDASEVAARVAIVLRQRSEIHKARSEAALDPASGLFTRSSFERLFHQEVAVAKRYRQPVALVLLDADGLVKVNSRFGWIIGNHYIEALGSAIAETCRASDIGARLGGGEFGVLLPETNMAGVAQFLIRLWQTLATARVHIPLGRHSIKVSASMGYAVFGAHAEDAAALWNAAVESLAHAKQIPGVSTERRLSA
ncbi:MAG: diguanylate cyclase [Nitrospirae bacterium]|nr:diguanylate cyclase [Nitrospirota bacterium]